MPEREAQLYIPPTRADIEMAYAIDDVHDMAQAERNRSRMSPIENDAWNVSSEPGADRQNLHAPTNQPSNPDTSNQPTTTMALPRDEQIKRDARDAYDERDADLLYSFRKSTENLAAKQAKLDVSLRSSKGDKTGLAEAQKLYETRRSQVNNRLIQHLRDKGYSGKEITQELVRQDVGNNSKYTVNIPVKDESNDNGYKITTARRVSEGESGIIRDMTRKEIERRGKEGKFSNWWAKQNMLVKAGVVVVPSAVIGAAAPLIAGAAGLGAGAALVSGGVGVTGRRLASGLAVARLNGRASAANEAQSRTGERHKAIQKPVHEAANKAQNELDRDTFAKVGKALNDTQQQGITDKYEQTVFKTGDITSEYIEGAKQAQSRNRKRLLKVGGVALVAGGVASELAAGELGIKDKVSGLFNGDNGSGGNINPAQPPVENNLEPLDSGGTGSEQPDGGTDSGDQPADRENSPSDKMTVDSGHGVTQEMEQALPGHSDEEYYRAYQAASERFNGQLFEGIDTYTMGNGDIGLSQAGDTGRWAPGVREYMESQLKKS